MLHPPLLLLLPRPPMSPHPCPTGRNSSLTAATSQLAASPRVRVIDVLSEEEEETRRKLLALTSLRGLRVGMGGSV
jgi:hypothetical protein